MPVVTPDEYREMIDRAKSSGFAYPAVNVRSSVALNAALRGFAEAASDGIIQLTVRSTEFWAGSYSGNRITGAVAFADFARTVAADYPVNIALHTDHCTRDDLEGFLIPLISVSRDRINRGGEPLFQSHMWDGSALPLAENLSIADHLLQLCADARMLLEIELGVIGGAEEGHTGRHHDRLYSTPDDALHAVDVLGTGARGRYLVAAAFGNVHGVYQPGNVTLRPDLLGEIQEVVAHHVGVDRPLDLVFHGGSGSKPDDIHEAIAHGVVKMNIDTATQYAFTRPIADHMFRHYQRILNIDGELGDKGVYDPRAYLQKAEESMAAQVAQICTDLGSAGKTMR